MTETKKITDKATGATYYTEETVQYGEKTAAILDLWEWAEIGWAELEIPAEANRRVTVNLDHIRKLAA